MPAIVRKGDSLSTGHGCTGETTLATANQGSVYVDGILVAVVGAVTEVHTILAPPCVPHTANLNAGSPTVFFEGIAGGRVGDSADAGEMISGSTTTFAN
jgi:uncharacterized Zn-binding protein involved in type VI secretion